MNKKEQLLRQFNEAFAQHDIDTILKFVSKNIRWTIVGDQLIEGIVAFRHALEEMNSEQPIKLSIDNVITRGRIAVVNGQMRSKEKKTYDFCDIYIFNKSNNPKIKEMRSYVVELTPTKVV
jgi:ketosteroid isomerase-like protein